MENKLNVQIICAVFLCIFKPLVLNGWYQGQRSPGRSQPKKKKKPVVESKYDYKTIEEALCSVSFVQKHFVLVKMCLRSCWKFAVDKCHILPCDLLVVVTCCSIYPPTILFADRAFNFLKWYEFVVTFHCRTLSPALKNKQLWWKKNSLINHMWVFRLFVGIFAFSLCFIHLAEEWSCKKC